MGSTNETRRIEASEKQRQPVAEVALEFQPDAIEIEDRPVPKAARATLYTLLSFILIAILWAYFSKEDVIIQGRGKIMTRDASMVVQAFEKATIKRFLVRPGDIVRKGDPLVELDPTFPGADVNQLTAQLHSIDAQIKRLEAEHKGYEFAVDPQAECVHDEELQMAICKARQAEYDARLHSFEEKISEREATLASNRAEIDNAQKQEKIFAEMEGMQNKLLRQSHGSRARLLEMQQRRVHFSGQVNALKQKNTELQRNIESLKSEKTAFVKEWKRKVIEELVNLQRERTRVNEELNKATERKNQTILRAQMDAEVLDVADRSPGSVVRDAEQLVTLVPLNTELLAEVDINTSNIGYIKKGLKVKLKLDAYPFQKHGAILGEVISVSRDTVQSRTMQAGSATAGMAALTGMQTQQQPVFRVRVRFEKIDLENLPHGKTILLPGMTLEADVKVGKRRIIDFFLYPIMKGLDNAFTPK